MKDRIHFSDTNKTESININKSKFFFVDWELCSLDIIVNFYLVIISIQNIKEFIA